MRGASPHIDKRPLQFIICMVLSAQDEDSRRQSPSVKPSVHHLPSCSPSWRRLRLRPFPLLHARSCDSGGSRLPVGGKPSPPQRR